MSGRLRHNMHFVMLVPKSLDPVARGQKLPVPDPRPSEKIAKLFPQVDVAKDPKNGAKPTEATTGAVTRQPAASAAVAVASPVPLPEPRPVVKPGREPRKQARRYRSQQQ